MELFSDYYLFTGVEICYYEIFLYAVALECYDKCLCCAIHYTIALWAVNNIFVLIIWIFTMKSKDLVCWKNILNNRKILKKSTIIFNLYIFIASKTINLMIFLTLQFMSKIHTENDIRKDYILWPSNFLKLFF